MGRQHRHRVRRPMIDFARYFAAVLIDGDYLNDYATHLPRNHAPHRG